MRVRLIICAVTVALVAAACGSDDPITTSEPTTTDAVDAAVPDPSRPEPSETSDSAESPAAPEAAPEPEPTASYAEPAATEDIAAAAPVDPGDVPDFEMIDVHTGTPVNLQSVVDGSTPLLLWFWAPH